MFFRKISAMGVSLFLAQCVLFSGCGYQYGSILPAGQDSIHVDNFENKIGASGDVSDKRASYSYRPGLEIDITKAVIQEFIFDGALKIKSSDNADLILTGELVDFRQYPLSYNEDQEDNDRRDVEEFRMQIYADIALSDNKTGKVLWKERSFMGRYSYTVVGPNAESEETAIGKTVKDLADRIVERVVEDW
ncbi:MAG: LPS assembly lipoprotein LptE [Candidatus Omnitrophica bacterium]|nr:LPS assembly lipoprotein LptE [Candidatus Omnitrophota bacterium]MDD5488940.1 LPS assembly lipoprotein LptE [Candidatus Omnitrophota bacterium]